MLLDLKMHSLVKDYTGLFLAGHIHFDDINLDKNYDRIKSYRQSKLANVLFCRELAARLQGSVQSTLCPINTALFINV